jgi:hypothetical protein
MMASRLVLLAFLLLVAGSISWAAEMAYFRPMRDAETRIASLRETLIDLRVRETGMREQLAQMGASDADLPSIADSMPGGGADAAVRLQEGVRNSIEALGGQTVSSQPVSIDLGGGYTKISLLLRARLDERGLLTLLHDLESSKPVTLVDSLEVHSLPIPGDTRPLDVTATITKFHVDVASS